MFLPFSTKKEKGGRDKVQIYIFFIRIILPKTLNRCGLSWKLTSKIKMITLSIKSGDSHKYLSKYKCTSIRGFGRAQSGWGFEDTWSLWLCKATFILMNKNNESSDSHLPFKTTMESIFSNHSLFSHNSFSHLEVISAKGTLPPSSRGRISG